MNQVWKQSLTQGCFHLETNHAQQLLRERTKVFPSQLTAKLATPQTHTHVMPEKETTR